MLSKIENGQASMSLDALVRISRALGATVYDLFRGQDPRPGGAQLVKAGEGMTVTRRGTQTGYSYRLLSYDKGPRRSFEPFLLSPV